jgi:cytochrome d ubiquinol oxidase subunit II
MTPAEACLALAFAGLVLYVVFGGADFGGGFWELTTWLRRRGREGERLVEETLAPVWEANHVWLIFVVVVAWTAFPRAVARAAAELLVPLTGAAIGIIVRGAAFVFLKADPSHRARPLYVLLFGLASLITPFSLGAAAGAMASGRVGAAAADAGVDLLVWLSPTALFAGTLAVAISAYLAAVFLTVEATRRGAPGRAEAYRRRALGAALVAGAIALGGLFVLRSDAPRLWEGLIRRGAPCVAASLLFGTATLPLLWTRRYALARVTAVGAVTSLLAGWAAGQYPWILSGRLLIEEAAAPAATLQAVLWSLGAGALLFVPPLVALLWLSQRGELGSRDEH